MLKNMIPANMLVKWYTGTDHTTLSTLIVDYVKIADNLEKIDQMVASNC